MDYIREQVNKLKELYKNRNNRSMSMTDLSVRANEISNEILIANEKLQQYRLDMYKKTVQDQFDAMLSQNQTPQQPQQSNQDNNDQQDKQDRFQNNMQQVEEFKRNVKIDDTKKRITSLFKGNPTVKLTEDNVKQVIEHHSNDGIVAHCLKELSQENILLFENQIMQTQNVETGEMEDKDTMLFYFNTEAVNKENR